MSSDWEESTLGECISFASGNTPSKANAHFWTGGTTPWISAKDMKSFWVADSADHLTPAGVAVASSVVPPGTTLLLTRGMTLHNDIPIVRTRTAATFNQDVKALSPRAGMLADFIPYLLLGNKMRIQALVDSAGHGTGRLGSEQLKQLRVLRPPTLTQKELSEFLGSIDERITLLRQTNATLESIAQALFKSWFVDFDPVRAKMDGGVPEGMDEAAAALFPENLKKAELGAIPDGWRHGTLADLSELNPESWTARVHPDSILYVDLANTKDNEIESAAELTFAEAPSRARRVLRGGDTIVGTVRPGNRSFAFIHKPASNLTASTGFAVLRPSSVENTEFVYLAATQSTSIEHLSHVADGGAYPAVRPDVVSALRCVVPCKGVLEAFHSVAEPLLAKVSENQKQAKTLTAVRDTLLPRLISGQLRLPELQRETEDALAA
jgi:restriction endonuclease S subunit